MNKTLIRGLIVSALFSSLPAAAGPIGVYYVTDGGDSANSIPATVWGIQGNTFQPNAMANPAKEGPVAIVAGEVRTYGVFPGNAGQGYTAAGSLTLTPTANSYPNALSEYFVDGTSDGTFNYSVSYALGSNAGKVFQFDADWSNPQVLFDTGNPLTFGITYDTTNNSFWTTSITGLGAGDQVFSNFDSAGNLLGSFFNPYTTIAFTALAMDLDHTLWVVGNADPADPGNGLLYHFATDGTFLGSETPTSPIRAALGGEITAVPEAGTSAAALGCLALAAGTWGWRRRTARAG